MSLPHVIGCGSQAIPDGTDADALVAWACPRDRLRFGPSAGRL